VKRVSDFFDRLGYRGYFIDGRELSAIETFDPAVMQNPANGPDLRAPLAERDRFARYIYNFLFFPEEEPQRTFQNIAARLAVL